MPHHRLFSPLPFVLLSAALAAQAGWSVPVLEPALNSTASDAGPHLSIDGLTLHFASYRSGNWEIYSSTRAAIGGPWSTPVQETALGGSTVEDQPFLSADGLEILFSSTNRAGGTGSSDVLRATRASVSSPWDPPTFVTEVNSTVAESAPSMTADGLELFFLSSGWGNPSGNNNSIFVATRAAVGQPFGTPALVTEFSNPNTHRDVEVSADGLTITYTEYLPAPVSRIKVFYSERVSRTSPWNPPSVWTEFDTVGTLQGVYSFTRSYSGNEAFLAAGFATAAGSQEIMSTSFTGLTHQGVAGLGATMTLSLRDPQRPSHWYSIGAALGNTGFPIGARTVPLDPDWLLFATLGASVPGYTGGFGGQLDADGRAAATLANSNPAFVGLQFWVGALTWDSSQPFGVGLISNAFLVRFQ